MLAALTASSFVLVASSSSSLPCLSSAGSSTGSIGRSRLPQTRSDTSHSWISASRTSGP